MSKKKTIDIAVTGTGTASLDELQEFQGELKKLSERNANKLRESILKNGFRIPVFVWNKKLLDGHQRVAVLKMMKADGYEIPRIPIIELQAKNEHDAKKVLLLINSRYGKIHEKGFFEFAEDFDFTELVGEINIPEVKIDLDESDEKAEDAIPEVDKKPTAKRGDIFRLGNHVLMCGDSVNPDDVKKLLDGEKAQMVFTDPPYNVDYGNYGNERWGKHRKIENDKKSDADWQVFVDGFVKSILQFCDGGIYLCMSCKEWGPMQEAFKRLGGHRSSTIIWAKDRFTLGRSDYQSQYESILYGWREGVKRFWVGERNLGDVWNIKRPSVSKLHPTMKPVEPVENAVMNSSRKNDIVLDLFAGSGTTFIACEKAGRCCRGMEIDAYYVDVIIARWEEFTGRKAEKVAGEKKTRKPGKK